MGRLIDNTIALRVAYLITKPFKTWPAFKLGIIDEDGNKLKEVESTEEKDSWTMLHRLCARLKKVVATAPGGKTFLGGLVASYFLMREDTEIDIEAINNIMDQLYIFAPDIMEEIATTTANVVGTGDDSSTPIKSSGVVRRKKLPSFKEFVNVK